MYSDEFLRSSLLVFCQRRVQRTCGCFVDSDYMNHVAEEINDKLQEQGQVTLAEVTTSYGLPAEFLANVRP